MMRQNLNDLAAFAVIARTRSFTAAAAELGVSTSALSHAIRALEERLDLRLLARTTRSVAPTEAGLALLDRLAPALAEIDEGLAALAEWRASPAGTVRLTTFHWLASTLLSRKLPGFLSSHPGVTVEVNVDDGLRDLVSLGFDAGIRFGESVERDMIAVRIGPSLRMAVVATPDYWSTHGRPRHPRDLLGHPCITYRNLGNGSLLPWDFEKDDKELRIQVRGPLACNSADLALAAVRASCGVGWTEQEDVSEDLATGRLERVLDEWCQPYPGAFLFHPSRRQVPAPLRALIDHFKE
ncbi:LysR family transcriptional regulator [Paracoccus marcusii]|uniref:LysR family transcriptional regulator n=1 Tax=Paracoccus marcusii TaxID=59779 RepID=A0ABY7UPG4_9RHOB|nr:LysR family transcriptional regulator [Paracoccus marcusii]WDA11826.1 LysR family transcriptional regulator [Paracoccus marcusii]